MVKLGCSGEVALRHILKLDFFAIGVCAVSVAEGGVQLHEHVSDLVEPTPELLGAIVVIVVGQKLELDLGVINQKVSVNAVDQNVVTRSEFFLQYIFLLNEPLKWGVGGASHRQFGLIRSLCVGD